MIFNNLTSDNMKIIFFSFFIGIGTFCFSQNESEVVKFRVTSESILKLGIGGEIEVTDLDEPKHISFDGNEINAKYDDGKLYFKYDVLRFQNGLDWISQSNGLYNYIIEIKKDGYIEYWNLSKQASVLGGFSYILQMPGMNYGKINYYKYWLYTEP